MDHVRERTRTGKRAAMSRPRIRSVSDMAPSSLAPSTSLRRGENDGGVRAAIILGAKLGERGGDIALHQEVEKIEHAGTVGEAQHVADIRLDDARLRMGDRAVEQREPVTRRAVRRSGNKLQRGVLRPDILLLRDAGKQARQFIGRETAQIETLAARQHGHRHFTDFDAASISITSTWRDSMMASQ